MRPEPKNRVRIAILQFLWSRPATRIGNVRLSLQKSFPATYRKGGNLTQIHRHLKELKQQGLISSKTIEGETWYWITSKGWQYLVGDVMTEIHSIQKEIAEISLFDDECNKELITETENPVPKINSSPYSAGHQYIWLKDVPDFLKLESNSHGNL